MKVRPGTLEDYEKILALLVACNVGVPEDPSGMGLCFVIVDDADTEILGTLSATFGNSTSAYIDYMAIKDKNKRAAYQLIHHAETILRFNGLKSYRFVCPEDADINEYFKSFGCTHEGLANYYTNNLYKKPA
jgi:hypothetical protein